MIWFLSTLSPLPHYEQSMYLMEVSVLLWKPLIWWIVFLAVELDAVAYVVRYWKQSLARFETGFALVCVQVPMKITDKVPDYQLHYLSHCDINNYLDSLAAKYPHLVQVKTIGHSFEKRLLKSIHISNSMRIVKPKRRVKSAIIRSNSVAVQSLSAINVDVKLAIKVCQRKPVILIDGGMHAREWCTISTALHCATQLTDHFEENKDLLDAFDFVIVPIVNADGYEYSRTFVCITNWYWILIDGKQRHCCPYFCV